MVRLRRINRNLRELGIMERFDDFEVKVREIIQNFIQESIYHEFTLQIGADRYMSGPNRGYLPVKESMRGF